MDFSVVILAAGKGTRMYSDIPKVLHTIGHQSFLEHLLCTINTLEQIPHKIYIVYGFDGLTIQKYIKNSSIYVTLQTKIVWVEQKEQLGTGHALAQILPFVSSNADMRILVLYADVPLISSVTLNKFVTTIAQNEFGLLTAKVICPYGLGRIARDQNDKVLRIVNELDATPDEREINEIWTGILLGQVSVFLQEVPKITPNNAQQEYYLTDVVNNIADKVKIKTSLCTDEFEIRGVNDKAQLIDLERYYQHKIAHKLLKSGVWIKDPLRFDLRGTLKVGKFVIIDIDVLLEGDIILGDSTKIGAFCQLKNCVIGNNVTILPYSSLEGAIIKDNCTVGPFARLRPQTILEEGVKIGNFCELKAAQVGAGSKISHLSYIGDAVIGKKVNLGASTITCNYDGTQKYVTHIGDGAFVGSHTSLIAPITIGEHALIGAGTTLLKSVPNNMLSINKKEQINKEKNR